MKFITKEDIGTPIDSRGSRTLTFGKDGPMGSSAVD
jgi:hypothetical protein